MGEAAAAEAVAVEVNDGALGSLPVLGSGLNYRPNFRADLFLNRPEIPFVEIVADAFLDASREQLRELDLLASHFVVLPHALDLSLGSADGLDRTYLKKLSEIIRRINPPWWSEHIAYTRAGATRIGHLTPLPLTRQAIDVVCHNVDRVRKVIGTPLLLENITVTMRMPGAEMSEPEFLSRILERTGCGLLLDVTNIHVNAINHIFDARRMMSELPLSRVVEVHYAGGHWRDGFLVDSHSRPVVPEVWDLLDWVMERAPVRAVTLERDENLPAFDQILDEVRLARELGCKHLRWS